MTTLLIYEGNVFNGIHWSLKQSCEVLIYHQSLHFLLYLHFWYNLPNTHIALVVEVKEQSLLFNIAHKIMSKVLVNCLKHILLILISDAPFGLECLITYNILVAYEILHSMKSNTHGRVGQVTLN